MSKTEAGTQGKIGMRRLSTCVTLALAVAALPGGASAQERLDRKAAAAPDGFVKIYNLFGSTRVIGWDRDSIAVSGTVGRDAGSFFMGGDGRATKLGFDSPAQESGARASHLEVRVPAGSRVWVKSASAYIDASGVRGGLDLYSVSGSIRVAGSPSEVYAESMDGDIEIAGSASSLRVKSASGSITLRGRSEDVTASTVSGNIALAGVRTQRGRFESVTGDIRFEGDFDRGASFEFESHSGTIELRVPAGVAADFTVSTLRGEVHNELAEAPLRPAGDLRGKELTFSTGSGGAEVAVRSFKGTVVLRKG
jgi:hypothetical protein